MKLVNSMQCRISHSCTDLAPHYSPQVTLHLNCVIVRADSRLIGKSCLSPCPTNTHWSFIPCYRSLICIVITWPRSYFQHLLCVLSKENLCIVFVLGRRIWDWSLGSNWLRHLVTIGLWPWLTLNFQSIPLFITKSHSPWKNHTHLRSLD